MLLVSSSNYVETIVFGVLRCFDTSIFVFQIFSTRNVTFFGNIQKQGKRSLGFEVKNEQRMQNIFFQYQAMSMHDYFQILNISRETSKKVQHIKFQLLFVEIDIKIGYVGRCLECQVENKLDVVIPIQQEPKGQSHLAFG